MQRRSTKLWRRINQPFVLALGFTILVGMSTASIWLDVKSGRDARQVEHTLEVKNKLAEVLLELRRADAAQRGYLLTGKSEFLDTYRSAAERLLPALATAKAATTRDPARRQTLTGYEPTLLAKLDELAEGIRLYQSGDPAAAADLIGTPMAMALTRDLLASVAALDRGQDALVAARSSAGARTTRWI